MRIGLLLRIASLAIVAAVGSVSVPAQMVGPPVQATIVELNSQSGHNVFTLNRGRTAGVVAGMKFFAVSPRNVYLLVEVSAVSDDNSRAYVITSGFKNHSGKEVKPRVGWKLTSRAPRKAYEYFPG